MGAAVLVSCDGAGVMTVEARGHVVECQCSITTRDMMDILHGKPIFVYIANMTANPVRLQKFMIVLYAPNAPICIKHAKDDEQYMLNEEDSVPEQGDKFNSDPTINTFDLIRLSAATSK